jgi:hypothetical protein
MMAAAVGLVIAMALALPGLLSVPPTPPSEEPPATATVRAKAPDLADGMTKPPAPADNQTLLIADVPSGMLTATVNGQSVGELQSTLVLDISRYTRPGENTLRIFWVGATDGNVKITFAAQAGTPRDVIRAFVIPSETAAPGERTITFFL